MRANNSRSSPDRLAWRLANGPLGDVIDAYSEMLRARRYKQGTASAYLRCLEHFSHWMGEAGLSLKDIDHALVSRFVKQHLPVCCCPEPCRHDVNSVHAALMHLLVVLPEPANDNLRSKPIAAELARFAEHLRSICGLSPLTCTYRISHVEAFLTYRFGDQAFDINALTSKDLETYLLALATRWRPSSCKVVSTDLRSYLRYRAMLGDDTRVLCATLPPIANWGNRHPPKVLSDVQLAQFLQAFDLTDPVGLRDYAIARCLLDLGLRGDETAHLTLDCFDWRNGIVTLRRTKSQRVQHLPLPVRTGEALGRYLQEARPQTDSRTLFVRHRAPFGIPLSVAAIRNAMNRAFVRCDLADRFCNTHVLRRSMATQLQKTGASIKEIADLLRHRDLNTARVYARVDLERLRGVALPWPGSGS